MSNVTDPIADMLTRIRNANQQKHDRVDVPASNLKREIARILRDEGYIRDFKNIIDGRQGIIRVYLKYYGPDRDRVIVNLKRVSKPGLRIYANKENIPEVIGGLGIAILSTSRGVMTDKQARHLGVGGEVLCYVG